MSYWEPGTDGRLLALTFLFLRVEQGHSRAKDPRHTMDIPDPLCKSGSEQLHRLPSFGEPGLGPINCNLSIWHIAGFPILYTMFVSAGTLLLDLGPPRDAIDHGATNDSVLLPLKQGPLRGLICGCVRLRLLEKPRPDSFAPVTPSRRT